MRRTSALQFDTRAINHRVRCAIMLVGALLVITNTAIAAPSDTAQQYMKWNSVGQKHTITTNTPLRFYYENLDEDDVYLKLLPTTKPGVFQVELRKMTNVKSEEMLIEKEKVVKQNTDLQKTVKTLEVQNQEAITKGNEIIRRLPPVLQRMTDTIRREKKTPELVKANLQRIDNDLATNRNDYEQTNNRATDLKREIDSLIRSGASPALILKKQSDLAALLEKLRLLTAERNVLEQERDYLQRENTVLDLENKASELELNNQRMLIWGLSALSVLLLLIAFVIYRNYKEKKRLNGVLEEKNVALDKEQAVSNGLLLNILPAPIAQRLKQGEKVIVDMFKNTTVMFIDLAGFTKLSSRTKPDQLVAMLNSIFSELDTLSEKYGVEKIKTIGDAYMVASGIPNTRADHAEAAARMALEAQRIVSKLRTPDGSPIEVRIGLASGEAIAGVIGTKKYIYDLWGDTVNTAARMESTGETGKIQCTQSVYDILKATFTFQKRGEIEVKGKGMMTTYFLTGSV